MTDIPFRGSHGDRLPTVRLQRAVLDRFKSVTHGEVVFPCGRRFIPCGAQSDILGLYGQNGSGKTALIEAMAVLMALMRGARVPPVYASCVQKGAPAARLSFTFDLQYPDGDVRKLVYAFSLRGEPVAAEEREQMPVDNPFFRGDSRVCVFDEQISVMGTFSGEPKKLQVILDSSPERPPYGPASKVRDFYRRTPEKDMALALNRALCREMSRSFLFSDETLGLFDREGEDMYGPYFRMLLEMRFYARYYLFVLDTKSAGMIRLNMNLPIYLPAARLVIDGASLLRVDPALVPRVEEMLGRMSEVLGSLIPGMSLRCRPAEGREEGVLLITARRGETELPVQQESDGVRRLISTLNLLIRVYNDPSVTVAVDEFDAGVFEYLLGELLQTLQRDGKGQFIFTAHNLRPLEVLPRECICFTTANPENRYFRMKNLGRTNNLRDVYLREVLRREQDEAVYEPAPPGAIANAFTRADPFVAR